jgi:O-antigen ligase
MGEDHPWLGVGVNNFRVESPNYVRRPGGPEDVYLITEDPHVVHNIYLQQLAETGIIGLALFATVLVLALRASWRGIRRLEEAGAGRLAGVGKSVFVAQLGGLTAAFFLSNGYDQVLWILLALGPALAALGDGMVRRSAAEVTA